MMIDVARLRDSAIVFKTKPEEFRSAVLLWCASWHQVPAASLPDDEAELAKFAGYGLGIKLWTKVRAGALRGFVKCSDGRLYHMVVAEKALAAFEAKLKQRWTSECGRLKKEAQRKKIKDWNRPDFSLWISRECPEFVPYLSKGNGHNVPEDSGPMSPGQPTPVPEKSAPREGKGREGILDSNNRFPGDESISAPIPPPTAVDPSTPETTARILAECRRATLEDATDSNPIIARWIRNGATPTQVTTALADARKSMPFPKALKAGYVDTILVALMHADATARAQAEAKINTTKQRITEQREAATHAAPPPDDLMKPFRKREAAA